MDHLSLYRKYRPHNFDNLVGQDHVRTTLINSFKNGQTAHAYLFTGPRGTGKTSTARIVAKAINCENLKDGFDPCDECDICKETAAGRLIDLIEIDAASNRGIDEVRDLKEKINFAPTRAKNKVYIIDEVHMMTKEAFNALLKTLEEPPSHVYFILATTEVHKIPETIVSRCQRFDFRRINEKALMTRLGYICQMEGVDGEEQALEAISRYVEGGLRDAINLLEQLSVGKKLEFAHVKEILGLSSLSFLEDFYLAITGEDVGKALGIVDETYHQGIDLRQFTHEFVDLLRKKMLAMVYEGKTNEAYRLSEVIVIFQETQQNMDTSIPQLPLEIAVVRAMIKDEQKISISVPVEAANIAPVLPAVAAVVAPISMPTSSAPVQVPEVTAPESSQDRTHQPIVTGELTLEKIRENWPRVSERIKNPALRISLKDAKVETIDEHGVLLRFSTQFHCDKICETANKADLELILSQVFGSYLKVVAVVKAIEVMAVEAPPVIASVPAKVESTGASSIEDAMSIFGV